MKEQKPSVGLSDTSGVDDIQWTVVKVFQVSLHDLIFGSTTLRINDYPRQLALARMAAIYLCRKRTGLGATAIARAFNRKPPAVGYAVRVIERLLAEESAPG
jgi:chromosomal replication initiation ATPase DnaA